VVVAGQVKPARVIKTVERVCGSWPGSAGPGRHQYRAQAAATGKSSSPGPGTASVPGGDDLADHRRPPKLQTGVAVRQLERFHQQALMLAFPSAPVAHRLDESAQAVAAILGGSNSRFYWNIVQQGLSARACVFREDYADFGLLVMPALCEPQNCEKLLDAMRHEARAMAAWGPEPKELQRVKNLRRTTLAAESEAPCYRLMQLADDLDYRGAPRTAEERLAAVEAVSSASIADYLREFPITGEGFLVSVGPRPWPAAE